MDDFAAREPAPSPVRRPRTSGCPACGSSEIEPFYRVQSIPLHSCILLESPEAARAFPRRDLELAFCDDCGFAFNVIFDAPSMAYSTNFEESQHFSDTFNTFARDLVREISETCEATGKQIVEIGCGKGEFLVQLCELAGACGIGIDPGYRADPGRTSGAVTVRFVPELFGPAHFDLPSDIVICRHTLEHIPAVRSFLAAIRQMIGPRRDVQVVFETPDFARVLQEGAFWDVYYEHCSYFSAGTHADLFRREGFVVDEVKLAYGGQYIVQYARPAAQPTRTIPPDPDVVAEMRRLVQDFPARVRQSQRDWRDRIEAANRSDRRVVLWGGSSKAVSLVTTLGLGAEIAAVVDINPYKQGKFLPGSGHAVIAPEALPEFDPGLVIVMNPLYQEEVSQRLTGLGISAEVVAL
ncbi:MAG TPA: class I SAM-dependent methyltransferase [Amaricoccus sp.]|uniref:class I SAM-dependent methyltransferase n=1 Tax=Amaricoccus sp. TaxID=1872485 RepID=UPI002C7DFA29|nr:class I SAM-dependent methyltransferase [Amaricoccus sp.]HMQ92250.1 class I SAM-dependent methyltransferase [Amaricoccus sp.]HMR51655.1 class I SAM-dependent methyltransferase [Amaricoccus sp.]HMR59066.1 class I SAM-dependent methyltransferase [Amaricoccus sp.]HMT98409.1 class I SAM-dependent methyltransferase [Amaricoccus sp.]